MTIKEIKFSERIAIQLIALSKEWEQENSCYGYRRNNSDDLKNKRIFVAADGDLIIYSVIMQQPRKILQFINRVLNILKLTSCTLNRNIEIAGSVKSCFNIQKRQCHPTLTL